MWRAPDVSLLSCGRTSKPPRRVRSEPPQTDGISTGSRNAAVLPGPVWQKLVFVLGGLMLPLSIYPGWLQSLALATPFAAMLYGPGSLVSGNEPGLALPLALKLLGWCALAAVVMCVLERRGVRRLEVEGG